MQRKVDAILEQWVHANTHRPLLIRGARRVGKTYCVKKLGKDIFGMDNFAYCDFQTSLDQLNRIFEGTTDVERIVADLSLFLRKPIVPGKTLIVLDEVQLCEKALNSLRFFAESDYLVIATGSQLGLTLRNRMLPFPSEVDHLYLRPLDFEEFLWALDLKFTAEGIRQHFKERRRFLLHEETLQHYLKYLVVGGMPRAVSAFAQGARFEDVRAIHAEINHTYTADIALYAPPGESVRVQAVWASVPKQLARETTRKFKYADVAKGGRERQFRTPLAWLEAAELVALNRQTNDTSAPLQARDGGSFFKVYLLDTGLMFFRYGIDAEVFLNEVSRKTLSAGFRGALAENYVMQALVANELETFYWTPKTNASAEVEFVVQNRRGQLIPIEVKSGDNVRSTSLRHFMEKSNSPCAVRLSTKNFGLEGGIFSVPLYAAFCLDEKALMNLDNEHEQIKRN